MVHVVFHKAKSIGVPGWLSQLSICLWLRSRSYSKESASPSPSACDFFFLSRNLKKKKKVFNFKNCPLLEIISLLLIKTSFFILKKDSNRETWVAQGLRVCLLFRVRSWSPGIKSCIELPEGNLLLSLPVSLKNK